MRYRDTLVKDSPSRFYGACVEAESCIRCSNSLDGEDYVSNLAQVHQMRATYTFTGGPLCEGCSESLIRWLKNGRKKKKHQK